MDVDPEDVENLVDGLAAIWTVYKLIERGTKINNTIHFESNMNIEAIRRIGASAMKLAEQCYVLYNPSKSLDGPVFWSNDFGWADFSSATLFAEERAHYPLGSVVMKFRDAEKMTREFYDNLFNESEQI